MKSLLSSLAVLAFPLVLAASQPLNVQIKGMSCSACEEKITKALMKIPGVTEVKADAKTGMTTIQTAEKSKVSMDAIKAAVKEAGFSVEGT